MKYIPLSQNRFAVIDDEDYERIHQHAWHFIEGYAKTNVRVPGPARRYTSIPMHRLIMNAPKGMQVDHIDGNGLNNTRANLRLATRSQIARNCAPYKTNRSGYKGVAYVQSDGTWAATIHKEGRNIQIGKRKTAVEAAALYNVAAQFLYGEFARVNIVPIEYFTPDVYRTVEQRLKDGEHRNVNNTSGYRGVRWNKRDGNWVAQIHPQGTGVTIGYFDDKDEAAYVYDQLALQLMGDKAKLNLL